MNRLHHITVFVSIWITTVIANSYVNNPDCETVGWPGTTNGSVECGVDAFSAVYTQYAPYLHLEHASFDGVVYDIVKSVIADCCGDDVYICLDNDVDGLRYTEELLTDSYQLALPVVKTTLTQINNIRGYSFLPVIETQGSMLIRRVHFEENPLTSSLAGTWPLAILVIATAGIAGIIVWILDRYGNPDEFPQSFIRGGWEGTWWAFVTMTTVGYGDRAPKSIPARVFGLVWMLVGIILLSIFTATLTAALTADTQKRYVVKGAKVGVIRGTLEKVVAYRTGAIITEYSSLEDVLDAVSDQKVDAGLLDYNVAMYSADTLDDYPTLVTDDVVQNSAVYGFILQNQTTDVEECFAKYTSKKMHAVYDHLSPHVKRLKRPSNTVAGDTSSRLMHPDPITLAVTCSIWILAFVGCMLWEFLYNRPKLRRQNKALPEMCVCGQGSKQDNDEEELNPSDPAKVKAAMESAQTGGLSQAKLKFPSAPNKVTPSSLTATDC